MRARDEEVAGALGGRAGQDRRLELEEVVRVEMRAHRPYHAVAQCERVEHASAA